MNPNRLGKRGGIKNFGQWRGGNNQNNRGQHNEHDDRKGGGGVTDIKRRVTFKNAGGRGGRGNNRLSTERIRAQLEADEEMGGDIISEMQQGGKQGGYKGRGGRGMRGRRSGSPPPRFMGAQGRKKLQAGTSGWFQVTISHGSKYEKAFVIQSLLERLSPLLFIPYYYRMDGKDSVFFVDDIKIAEKLQEASRQISTPNGFKMVIYVRSGIPQVQIDDSLKLRMKNAMIKRYHAPNKALDLSQFHADPDLLDVFVGLFRPTIMMAVIDIIAENIPELVALNLNNNKIHLLDHFKCVPTKLPNLAVLYLANNRVQNVSSLEPFRGLAIVELDLTGNPLKERYRDLSMYTSDVRNKFPKLMRLDGVDLPKQIGFDIEDQKNLPPAKASFLCNSGGADIVRQFLEQYFMIYDSDNRQPLLNAYHEHAMFSLTTAYSQQVNNTQRLYPYISYNRNLLRTRDNEQRLKHLKVGRLPIVSLLSELPATHHDPQSFGVDLTLFTEKLIMLTVTGLFKEKKSGSSVEVVRSFQRSLVIVPCGGGFCIKNELMHINVATNRQEKSIFNAPPANAAPIQQMPVTPVANPLGAGMNDDTKQNMILAMSNQSGMNMEWSRKCLEETNWDFDRAGFIFGELNKQNKIPAEAFVK
ncbi:nuclear RNA export factor 1-like [Culicoides brevitarsis]|uniref:nuclear RNA export factor 1-like n=1 Tax=Culicoides brevitarsis TaxID=469753 RepID=UPI00307C2AE6